ncbi:MAG TPA: hypothetical protein VNK91_08930, partial [Burkholderiaceae bacterium]|nr:hypothetical protein [Burkholderiaceae bacterium]
MPVAAAFARFRRHRRLGPRRQSHSAHFSGPSRNAAPWLSRVASRRDYDREKPPMSFAGRVLVITGASDGIGAALARELAA